MLKKTKNIALSPIYFYQAKRLKRDTVRLPEPDGVRAGTFSLASASAIKSEHVLDKDSVFHMAIIGDSSAAGVGVSTQQYALSHQLLKALSEQESLNSNYNAVQWQLHATTGHDSFDILRRLYLLPTSPSPLDVLIVVVGVNDTTKMQSVKQWKKNLAEIVAIANHKFSPKQVFFSAIPSMTAFPALPYPLNQFIDEKAKQLNLALQQFCAENDYISYAEGNFLDESSNAKSKVTEVNTDDFFAIDGFHPNKKAYKIWAEQLAVLISK